MWFTRTADTFRGHFAAVRSNGTLRTGLVAADFTATVVDPDDSASTTASVAESTEKAGLYYFDIPSAFFVANGVGEYGVVVEIDTTASSGTPNVIDVMSENLRLTVEDFDSLVDSVADQVWEETLADHSGTAGSTAEALDNAGSPPSPAAIADAVWDEPTAAHGAGGTFGLEVQGKAEPGDAMDLIAGSIDAATIVTGAIDADALAADAVAEIADQVWEEQLSDHSGTAGSTAEALDALSSPATPADIADAVWDEASLDHLTAGSTGELIRLIHGLVKGNFVLDNITITNGVMTGGRIRLFTTSTAAQAASAGSADGVDGEFAGYTISATPATCPGQATIMRVYKSFP